MKKFLQRKIVEPEITLYVWELLIIISVELSILVSEYLILSK